MALKKPNLKKKPMKGRVDWETNQELIEAKYIEIFHTKKKAPTPTELAELLGMSRQAISRHLQKLSLQKLVGSNTTKLLANTILQSMAMSAAKGDVKAAELYFKLVYGSEESLKIDVTSKGEKVAPIKAGDTYQILIPDWQEEIDLFNKDVSAGTGR